MRATFPTLSDEMTDSGPASAHLGGSIPIFRIRNLEASISYYVEQLGFKVDWRTDGFASVSRDRASIMLCEGGQGHSGTWIWIGASDVDALYEELGQRGAKLRQPPTNYPWGSRECHIIDPDDHVIRFGADLKPGEPMGEWLDSEGRRWMPTADGGWSQSE